ncbi:uncharacterized protein A4U43_C01F21050 [Asparagus officinalis]|uniref:Phosphofructokinase domain-containing protein n=1 Tax=Asparagus officinalis TaxID=4686 RepID=A0A5P1FQZ6_ASPOF|nr:uncharacterized protein A4U43_C01F21050 [Asparagus officinalis]
MLPSRGQLKSFIDAICMLRDPVILHLRAHRPHPTCVISDNIHYWARDVAREFNIPRLVFHGCGCFPLLCVRRARTKEIEETIKDENEPFVVPGLPRPVMITKAQVGSFFRLTDEHAKGVREAELRNALYLLHQLHVDSTSDFWKILEETCLEFIIYVINLKIFCLWFITWRSRYHGYKSFGFDIAVEEAQRAINAAHVEASSVENDIGVVKLMGRHSGFVAMYATLGSRDVVSMSDPCNNIS